jgi:Transposase IS66 family
MRLLKTSESRKMRNKPERSQQESDATRVANETKKLRLLIKQLKRTRFGYNLEQTDRDLFQLGLEDLEQCIAAAVTNHCSNDRQAVLIEEKPSVPIISLAQVLIKKYAEHLSLHHQVKILAKQNIHLDVSALSHLVGHVCHLLSPLPTKY